MSWPTYTVQDIGVFSNIIGEHRAWQIVDYRRGRRYAVPSDIKLADGIGEGIYQKLRNYITTFSYDLNTNRYGERRINLNNASFETLLQVLGNLGLKECCGRLRSIHCLQSSRVPPLYQSAGIVLG